MVVSHHVMELRTSGTASILNHLAISPATLYFWLILKIQTPHIHRTNFDCVLVKNVTFQILQCYTPGNHIPALSQNLFLLLFVVGG